MRRQQKWIANVRFIKLQEVNGFVAYGTVLTVIVWKKISQSAGKLRYNRNACLKRKTGKNDRMEQYYLWNEILRREVC